VCTCTRMDVCVRVYMGSWTCCLYMCTSFDLQTSKQHEIHRLVLVTHHYTHNVTSVTHVYFILIATIYFVHTGIHISSVNYPIFIFIHTYIECHRNNCTDFNCDNSISGAEQYRAFRQRSVRFELFAWSLSLNKISYAQGFRWPRYRVR
jgi:hypothetical protein